MHPFEFILHATPVSLQARRRQRLHDWKDEVRAIAEKRRDELSPGYVAEELPVCATVLYFTAAPLTGDVDNIVKPILDALVDVAYLDDRQVERVLVQKIEPHMECVFIAPSEMLAEAIEGNAPSVYVRIDADLGWRSIG